MTTEAKMRLWGLGVNPIELRRIVFLRNAEQNDETAPLPLALHVLSFHHSSDDAANS
jgi:hypothetical protein